MPVDGIPRITVVISTRNREESLLCTVKSILSNDYPSFNIVIVDQSDTDGTKVLLQPFLSRPEFRYVQTTTRGLAIGRNIGIGHAESEYIALTDDDCEVPKDWLEEIVQAFAVDKRVGIVFGNVLTAPCDANAGFIPAYVRDKPALAQSIREKHQVEGMGACMGLRRAVWQQLHGFDEMFGAGGRLRAAEELDLTVRALLAGHAVYHTPDVAVLHTGFRTWEQGRSLVWNYLYGTGAMFAKQFKCGLWSVGEILCRVAWRWALQGPAISVGKAPLRMLRLQAFTRGFLDGALLPVNRMTGHYVSPPMQA